MRKKSLEENTFTHVTNHPRDLNHTLSIVTQIFTSGRLFGKRKWEWKTLLRRPQLDSSGIFDSNGLEC